MESLHTLGGIKNFRWKLLKEVLLRLFSDIAQWWRAKTSFMIGDDIIKVYIQWPEE